MGDELTEKKVKRENQKKKKQERKRKKREALLKAALFKAEQEKKMESQLGHDLEVNSALVKKNVEGKDKKRKHDTPITNGHSSPIKKAKIENTESTGKVKAMEINKNLPEETKKKKKKKNKEKVDGAETKEDVQKVDEKEPNNIEKIPNSILQEVPEKELSKPISESDSPVEAIKSDMKKVGESDADKKLKKKKKKLKKE